MIKANKDLYNKTMKKQSNLVLDISFLENIRLYLKNEMIYRFVVL